MSSAVSITGIGLVTPLGRTAPANWQALLAGRFISHHSPIADADIFQLAQSAAMEAITDARWDIKCGMGGSPRSSADQSRAAPATNSTALIVGTSKGPIKSWISHNDLSHGLSEVADVLRPLMPFRNSLTVSAACASGLHALIRAALMIQHQEVDRALVVAAEASVHPLFLSSFQRLGVLARPTVGCRPFDQDREGFLMSEAAAAICLERGKAGYATIESFGLGGDARHLISSDPNATTLRRVLQQIGEGRRFDLIHAHGTGTVVNDAIELNAIESELTSPSPATAGEGGDEGVFERRESLDIRNHPRPNPLPDYRERAKERPSLYSHKGAIGHSLGAAGLVAVAINAMAHRHSIVPPNVRMSKPMPCARVTISQNSVQRHVGRSAVVASGFGGAVAAVGLASTAQV